jgi:Ca2+-binding RTX toxin-like protein
LPRAQDVSDLSSVARTSSEWDFILGGLLKMRHRSVNLESLETRRLLAAVYPTVFEQYMIELYNYARMHPAAIEAEYGFGLNEGPPAYPISYDPKQPLAVNPFLMDSARSYAQFLLTSGEFSHTADGHQPWERMAAAGYIFGAPSGSNESALKRMGGNYNDLAWLAEVDVYSYFTDAGVAGRWHRLNMMDPNMKEVGAGIAIGSNGWMNQAISVINCAYSGTMSFLTGVAYTDSSGNNRYNPGEQMGGVNIVAIRNSDGAQFTTTTWASGGYSLALPAGTYTVWGGGGTLGGWVKYTTVAIDSQNVKRDFRPDYVNSQSGPGADPDPDPDPDPNPDPDPDPDFWATFENGVLTVNGTDSADQITVRIVNGDLHVWRNGVLKSFVLSWVTSISVIGGAGNDQITIEPGVIGATIFGGAGNDTITGGDGADVIWGGDGADSIKSGAGADTVLAGEGNDRVYGERGADSLKGEGGRDRLMGGDDDDKLLGGNHNDSLFGEAGDDSLWGQNLDDCLDGGAGADYFTGGKGFDTADYSTRTANLYIEIERNYSSRFGKSGVSGEHDNVLNDVENITAGSGNDRLIGSSLPNVIKGNAGADTIYGMAGADTLLGGAGDDRFFTQDSTKDLVDGGDGVDRITGDASELLASVEKR